MNRLEIDQISREEFKVDIKQIFTDVAQFYYEAILSQIENGFLTRQETAQRLGLSLPTLNAYTKSGIIPAYRIGSIVRYKTTEVEAALQKVQAVKGKRV